MDNINSRNVFSDTRKLMSENDVITYIKNNDGLNSNINTLTTGGEAFIDTDINGVNITYVNPPTILSPIDNSSGVINVSIEYVDGVRLSFLNKSSITEVQISTTVDFTNVQETLTTKNNIVTPGTLSDGTQYFIRGRTYVGNNKVTSDFLSDWSTVTSFTTGVTTVIFTPTITDNANTSGFTPYYDTVITSSAFSAVGLTTHDSTTWTLVETLTGNTILNIPNSTTNLISLKLLHTDITPGTQYQVYVTHHSGTYSSPTSSHGFTVSSDLYSGATLHYAVSNTLVPTIDTLRYPIICGYQRAVTLLDGRIVVIGGQLPSYVSLSTTFYDSVNNCYILDPNNLQNGFIAIDPYPTPIAFNGVSILPDGNILSYGGTIQTRVLGTITKTFNNNCYILDKNTLLWTQLIEPVPVSNLVSNRAVKLNDGRVLGVGGIYYNTTGSTNTKLSYNLIYDPTLPDGSRWSTEPTTASTNYLSEVTIDNNGLVYLLGGIQYNNADNFVWVRDISGVWSNITTYQGQKISNHGLVILANGNLTAFGSEVTITNTDGGWSLINGVWTKLPGWTNIYESRAAYAMANDGSIYIIGGLSPLGYTDTVLIYG